MSIFSSNRGEQNNTFLLGDNSKSDKFIGDVEITRNRKDDSKACFKNALDMLLELEAVYINFKKQGLIKKANL